MLDLQMPNVMTSCLMGLLFKIVVNYEQYGQHNIVQSGYKTSSKILPMYELAFSCSHVTGTVTVVVYQLFSQIGFLPDKYSHYTVCSLYSDMIHLCFRFWNYCTMQYLVCLTG